MHRIVHSKYLFPFIVLCFIVLLAIFTSPVLADSSIHHLDVPSQHDIQTDGYPKNQNGETYGPDVKESTDSPDLILVQSDNMLGYIKASDLDDGVTSLTDALSSNPVDRVIPVYLQDGITVIGSFVVNTGEFTMG